MAVNVIADPAGCGAGRSAVSDVSVRGAVLVELPDVPEPDPDVPEPEPDVPEPEPDVPLPDPDDPDELDAPEIGKAMLTFDWAFA
jgi:hypothetical protein